MKTYIVFQDNPKGVSPLALYKKVKAKHAWAAAEISGFTGRLLVVEMELGYARLFDVNQKVTVTVAPISDGKRWPDS
jgi:hypothetical protein